MTVSSSLKIEMEICKVSPDYFPLRCCFFYFQQILHHPQRTAWNRLLPLLCWYSYCSAFFQLTAAEPEYIKGQHYPLLVNKTTPKIFFIANQQTVTKEIKWFVMGGLVLIMGAVFGIVSRMAG